MVDGVSFQGKADAQSLRLKSLRQAVQDLQRQMTTQKKYERLSGFGFQSLSAQRYRMDTSRLESYLDNIDHTSTRIKLMTNSMSEAANQGRQLLSALNTEVLGGELDIGTINTIAKNALSFVQSLVNSEHDGRYLFAGSATTSQPFTDKLGLENTYQTQVADWLSGAQTTTQLLNNSDGYTPTQLGFNASLGSAGSVATRIDESVELDYTVIATENGFEDLIRGLSFAANMKLPDPATDVPDLTEFTTVMKNIADTVRRGVAAMDQAVAGLGSKFTLITSMQNSHEQELAMVQSLSDELENVDTTEVVAKLQIAQTQLESSYQITGIVSQLTLVNYL